MPILKLDDHNEELELEFEVAYQRSLSFEERLKMMLEESNRVLEFLIKNGQRKPFEVIKRS